jgi:hypothetical protein
MMKSNCECIFFLQRKELFIIIVKLKNERALSQAGEKPQCCGVKAQKNERVVV